MTTAPGSATSATASTPSQQTASTRPVTSPSWSLRKASPLRLARRLTSRTTNTVSTCWPSTRSRANTFSVTVGMRTACSIGRSNLRSRPDGPALRVLRMHAVLVAGGTGALGGAVLRELLDAGHPVTATWVVEKERERVAEEDSLSLVQADLMDPSAVEEAVNGVEDLGAVV